MPVNKVYITKNGKTVVGYKWGNSGKVYTGSGAAQKAMAQGAAAYASGYNAAE